jgi:MSHA pilin protein MshC
MKKVASNRGFTLIELIIVIVILGVISIYAAPRILDTNSFNQRGLYDETIALLRYAQKTAIAQRRTVCVTFDTASATLTIATNAADTVCATTATTPLSGPRGEVPAGISGRGTAAYGSTPGLGVLNFNGLGQPVNNSGGPLPTQTITVTGGPADVTVQAVTGYVQ